MRIHVSILTPDYYRKSGTWGELILLSFSSPLIPDHLDEKSFEELMQNHNHEWSAILVLREAGRIAVHLWRSLTSSFDICYLLKDSDLYLSDAVSGCAVHLPPVRRVSSNDAIIDHFLFPTVFGENTHFEDVKRLGNGMRATIHGHDLTLRTKQFSRYTPNPRLRDEKQCISEIDAALERALKDVQSHEHALMFSGGVDSSLLATYLPNSPLVTHSITSPEFAGEVQYATSAATLLGKSVRINEVPETDLFGQLERTIDQLWMPTNDTQTLLFLRTFNSDARRFVIGQLADGLFGLFRHKDAYYGPMLAKPMVAPFVGLLAALPSRKIRHAWEVAKMFRVPPTQPGSFAFQFARRTNASTVALIFSQRDIDRRLVARYEYVSQFLDFEVYDNSAEAQFELGHLIDLFCEDNLKMLRHLASSCNKSMYAPFATRNSFDIAMSIPVSTRYMDKHTEKHLLKKLLIRRLPAYPIHQGKKGGKLPFQRYLTSGPLKDWSQRYPPPDFIDAAALQRMFENDFIAFWRVVLLSIWKVRVANLEETPPAALSLEVEG